MPKTGSCAANFPATSTSAARVLEACGVKSMLRTSHRTRTSSPPRIGSGQEKTGLRTRSEEWPSAWFVEDPSKPQIGSASRPGGSPAMIFVLERSLAVGWVPSIQMYSALKVTGHFLRGCVYALAGAAALRHWGAAVD